MATAVHKERVNASPACVWAVITDLAGYGWRSDLQEIRVLDDDRFVEIDRGGYSTTFTVTRREKYACYAFTMENENMSGSWTGLLEPDGGGTMLTFTEEVRAKKWYMAPFVGPYLKKQQAQYFADLRKALQQAGE